MGPSGDDALPRHAFLLVDGTLLRLALEHGAVRVVERTARPDVALVTGDGSGTVALVGESLPHGVPPHPVRVARARGAEPLEVVREVPLPENFFAECAIYHRGNLFVGGMVVPPLGAPRDSPWGPAVCVLAPGADSFERLPLPSSEPGATKPGKAVDALVVSNGELLAFDNVHLPILLFVYALDAEGHATPRATHDLGGGLSARVAGAVAHGGLVVVLEFGGSRAGPWHELAFFDRTTYAPLGHYALPDPDARDDDDAPPSRDRPRLTCLAEADGMLHVGATAALGVASLRELDARLSRGHDAQAANETVLAAALRWAPSAPVRALAAREGSVIAALATATGLEVRRVQVAG